jgi:diguanylate cyclase (GGDEF)-like protein
VTDSPRPPIRLLVVDDEQEIIESYRRTLVASDVHPETEDLRRLGAKLFQNRDAPRRNARSSPVISFDPTFCNGAEAAVEAVRLSLAEDRPYAVVFLDMRMPPGPDGVWAAARIREIDPAVEIVVCTAYSDVDPHDIGGIVPPVEKLSYLQKPFHPHEVKQMAIALASKWRAERHIIRLAYFDSLTGLPNREQARSRLLAALEASRTRGTPLAVLYIDLDNFKRINDTLGHGVGDEVLTVAADRLRKSLRYCDDWAHGSSMKDHPGDIARLGGDEFVVVLPQIRESADASLVAERLISVLQQPMKLAQNTVVVTPSIGIAISPSDGNDADALLRHADLAMYFAKRRAAGTYAYFDPSMTAGALKRYTIEEAMRGALERGEFTLHYQPQLDMADGTIDGVEALLRWNHPELGSVPPDDFIPVAEATGMIFPIGDWVLRTACLQAKRWHDEGLPLNRMAVNISAQQFAMGEFPGRVAEIIREVGISPRMVELEITESTVMRDEAWAAKALDKLRSIGVSIAIDDFGTGYSNFGRLHHLHVDRLKMDRTFVHGIGEHKDGHAIAAAIIAMAKSLHVDVVAEGVESVTQLTMLRDHECAHAQGFLLSRPLCTDDITQLLHRAAGHFDASRTQRIQKLIG